MPRTKDGGWLLDESDWAEFDMVEKIASLIEDGDREKVAAAVEGTE